MNQRRWRSLLVVFALPFVLGGNCAFFFSSGGGSSDDDEPRKGLTVVVTDGQFVDAPVQGLYYESGTLSGFTDRDGRFQYEEGGEVRFFIGDIPLGEPETEIPCSAILSAKKEGNSCTRELSMLSRPL